MKTQSQVLELSIIVERQPSNVVGYNYKAWSPDLPDLFMNHGWSHATPDRAINTVEHLLRDQYGKHKFVIAVRYPITDVESG